MSYSSYPGYRSTSFNPYNYKRRLNGRRTRKKKREIIPVNEIRKTIKEFEDREISRSNFEYLKEKLKYSELNDKEADDILDIIKKARQTATKRITSDNKAMINSILFDGASGSIKEISEINEEDLEVSGEINFDPVCLNHSKSDCPTDKCVYQKGKCLPNILKNESICYNKDFHSCVKPCKFFGRSVHDKNACFYYYNNVAEAKEEHKLISDHVRNFEKYVVILRKKAKSLLSFLTYKVRKIDKKLGKLKILKSKYENEMTKSGVDHSTISEKLGEVMKETTDLTMQKTEADALLTSIKFISELNQTSLNTKKLRKFRGESILNKENNRLKNRTLRTRY